MRCCQLALISVVLLNASAYADFRTIDGTNNNETHTNWGAVDTQLLRWTGVGYDDDISSPRTLDSTGLSPLPSARAVSNAVAAQTSPTPNAHLMSDYVWVWGQFLDHDIDLTENHEPHEPFDIVVPAGDPLFSGTIGLNRSTYDTATGTSAANPRQQINQITAYIDASNVYGSDTTRANALRTMADGKLKTSAGDLLPFNTAGLPNAGGTGAGLFLAGDVRANENVVLTSMHTLFVREHNRLADEFGARLDANEAGLVQAFNDSTLSRDEFVYQASRKVVGAQMQVITYDEFLPALLGDGALTTYTGYKTDVDAGIANEFSTAVYRLGHSLLSPEIAMVNPDGTDAGSLALRDAFFNPSAVSTNGIDAFLHGACLQESQEIDNMIVDDVRNFLFGPPGAGGFDLASLNIQRGRDHGLPGYNQARIDLGLLPATDLLDLTGGDADLAAKLASVYASVDDVDLWVGGLAEPHHGAGAVGQTIRMVMIDQFTALRDGDRFWYQNDAMLADLYDLAALGDTTLGDIIARNTAMTDMPDNVFVVPEPTAAALLALAGLAALCRHRKPLAA